MTRGYLAKTLMRILQRPMLGEVDNVHKRTLYVHYRPHHNVLFRCVNTANFTTAWTLQYPQQGIPLTRCVVYSKYRIWASPTSLCHQRRESSTQRLPIRVCLYTTTITLGNCWGIIPKNDACSILYKASTLIRTQTAAYYILRQQKIRRYVMLIQCTDCSAVTPLPVLFQRW